MTRIRTLLVIVAVALGLAACSGHGVPESDVFTLYSTNFPHDHGRSGVATYDLAKEPLNGMMCEEAAKLYQADFERRKKENGWSADTKMRYWCEKGRFKEVNGVSVRFLRQTRTSPSGKVTLTPFFR